MIKRKGFTLIELLVVIGIIALLSTLAVVALNNARLKARDAKRVADVKQIQTALELYYQEATAYPNQTAAGALALGKLTDCTTACDTISSTNGVAAAAAGTTYMGLIPGDPSGTAECTAASTSACIASYITDTTTSDYEILFYLEGATGSLGAGVNCANENGIVTATSC